MDSDLIVIFAFVLALVGMLNWFRLQRTRGPGLGTTRLGATGLGTTGLGASDQQALDRALEHARRLEERIESLERVLDQDLPGWRRKVSA